MKVRFAANAKRDLREIGLHISEDNVPRSITFVEEVRDRCLALVHHPHRFPVATSFRGAPLRKMTHGNYLIFYATERSTVEILRIVHSARDWSRLFDSWDFD